MRRKIGPLPLTGGLQLDEPEGRPDGLLDARNVEALGGHLATRRGQSLIGTTWSSVGGFTTQTDSPALWTGETVIYFGFDPAQLASDGYVEDDLVIINCSTGNTSEPEVSASFWGEDNAWHDLDFLNPKLLVGLAPTFFNGVLGQRFAFRHPHGWKTGTPTSTGLAAGLRWIRLTFTAALTIGAASVSVAAPNKSRKFVYAFTARSGAKCIAITRTHTTGRCIIYDVDRLAPNSTSTSLLQLNTDDAALACNQGDQFDALYVAATDEVLFNLGAAGLRTWDVGEDMGVPEAFAPLTGDDIVDTPYEDIVVESNLPTPRVLATYAGYVFAANFPGKPHEFRWSAEGAYWKIWPSENVDTLASRGSGPIVGAAELGGALFMFTTTSIFRFQLVPAPDDSETGLPILYVDHVEDVGCVVGRSVVLCGDRILFLAEDGVRAFDGTRSRNVSKSVRDLFRRDSDHPMAVRRNDKICAAHHPVANEYRLFYPRAGSLENDCGLAIQLDTGACWLHGADDVAGLDTEGATQPIGQRRRGVRAMHAVWHPEREAIVGVDAAGVVFEMDSGEQDIESKVEAYAETHAYGLGDSREKWLRRVDVTAAREHLEAARFKLIPDGNRARAETRDIASNPIETTFSSSPGVAQAGTALSQVDKGYAPHVVRSCLKGRNFRVRIETKGSAHAPFKIASMDLEVEVGGRR
jgi:hypothetical protein